MCKLAKYIRNCVVFWKNLHSWQNFTRPPVATNSKSDHALMKRCQKLCRALPPSFGQNPKECILFLRRTSLKGKREKSFQCCWISGFSRNRRNMIYFHSASIRGSVRGISFSLFVSDKCFREMFQMIRGRKDSADKNYLGFQDKNFGRHFFLQYKQDH